MTSAAAAPTKVSGYDITGPFTHDNLTIFLLHGPDTLPERPIAMLDEALAKKTFVVHETGTVNELQVENLSTDEDVLIQPGDIVKGGRQDRLIAAAVLVPAKSGKLAVPSFCVEQGRWQQRGVEQAGSFAANLNLAAGKDLRNAALVNGRQTEVWANVQTLQAKLSANVAKPVANAQSPTSLQLALEDTSVLERLKAYESVLAPVVRAERPPVGYVVAVNGKVTGAEVYGSSVVMAKAWPKALKAAAVEALAEWEAGVASRVPGAVVARAFLADTERGADERQADERQLATVSDLAWMLNTGSVVGDATVAYRDNVVAEGQALRQSLPLLSEFQRDELLVPNRNVGTAIAQTAANQVNTPVLNRAEQTFLAGVYYERRDAVLQRPIQSQVNPERNPVMNSTIVYHTRLAGRANVNLNNASVTAPAPVSVNRVQGKGGVMVESRDRNNPSVVIHRSFIAK
ncbi:hypothetical protein FRUB_08925 [Fimbriiglobus ruber]|uniref:ARG and Rhodanese-Phosphatase-superfamily-associated domain-containing protein n=1 Tax=Fimbriiglobus ruber TaxID=1908690 RepID=A0A225D4E6_9BACT|nr:hypothetical protein FRUB_08925 [Fimbriiglobus ruber]